MWGAVVFQMARPLPCPLDLDDQWEPFLLYLPPQSHWSKGRVKKVICQSVWITKVENFSPSKSKVSPWLIPKLFSLLLLNQHGVWLICLVRWGVWNGDNSMYVLGKHVCKLWAQGYKFINVGIIFVKRFFVRLKFMIRVRYLSLLAENILFILISLINRIK